MKNIAIKPIASIDATIEDIAPDKSISHRCALFSLLSDKPSFIRNFLQGEDTLSMLKIVQSLGAKVQTDDGMIKITPPKELLEPKDLLECSNAGTAMRLLIGFLSTKSGFFVLSGDKYLNSRPMKRVIAPLKKIGAKIDGRKDGEFAPLAIRGKKLQPFRYESPISSAQVKSAMILAALDLDDKSYFKEPFLSRDHSEKMLHFMGVKMEHEDGYLVIHPQKKPLKPLDMSVPSDPSSGFFFAVLVALIPHSKIVLKNMLLNKTRVEAYRVLQKMGLDIEFRQTSDSYDLVGDIIVKHAPLNGVVVEENIPWLIDEIPALAIAFAHAKGQSEVKNAKELRVKESDRIKSVVENLTKCGIKVQERDDGFVVDGGEMKRAKVRSFGDHRVAMSFIVAGLKCGMEVEDIECIDTSFPNFFDILKTLGFHGD